MCGIAGYSLTASSPLERTLAAQALLAGIAERGADAVGYAHRSPGERVSVHKQRSGASALLDEITVPQSATELLVHVRDYTKGHPTVAANNHPIRHGAVIGIHNGVILNDDELLADHECARREPGMTVDSEAIFAVAAHSEGAAEALEALRGSMATAWIDERREESVSLALEVVERFLGLKLELAELEEGTLVQLERGRQTSRTRFNPDRQFEDSPR